MSHTTQGTLLLDKACAIRDAIWPALKANR